MHPQRLCNLAGASNPVAIFLLVLGPKPPESNYQQGGSYIQSVSIVVNVIQQLRTKVMRFACHGPAAVAGFLDKTVRAYSEPHEEDGLQD